MSKAVLWEASGKYVPIVFHASFYYNRADLFIIEKILIDNGDDGYKRIRLIGRKVSFANDGAVPARAGSIVVGLVQIGAPVGFSKKFEICGYVVENETFDQWSSYGEVALKNIRTTSCPYDHYPADDRIYYIMDYYTYLLNNGMDIDSVDKGYIQGEELERTIKALMLASIKEKLTGAPS